MGPLRFHYWILLPVLLVQWHALWICPLRLCQCLSSALEQSVSKRRRYKETLYILFSPSSVLVILAKYSRTLFYVPGHFIGTFCRNKFDLLARKQRDGFWGLFLASSGRLVDHRIRIYLWYSATDLLKIKSLMRYGSSTFSFACCSFSSEARFSPSGWDKRGSSFNSSSSSDSTSDLAFGKSFLVLIIWSFTVVVLSKSVAAT